LICETDSSVYYLVDPASTAKTAGRELLAECCLHGLITKIVIPMMMSVSTLYFAGRE